MITLQPITETNYLEAVALQVSPEQQAFVAPAVGILARAYAYRRHRANAWGIYDGRRMVGLALMEDLDEEPVCYHLSELLIDEKEQGRGYGQAALALLLAQCRREGKYPRVEVCVKKMDEAAIHIYEKAGFRDTGYTDPDAPDSLCMAWDLPEVWRGKVELRLTGIQDLEQVRRLWATPSVMHYVGFPEGLHETMDHLRNEWLPWVQQPPKRQHWSVYAEGCGLLWRDLLPCGRDRSCLYGHQAPGLRRGKGIGYLALSQALDTAFRVGGAARAYVDPHPENRKALALYAALGFLPAVRPSHLEPWDSTYFELTRENWEARHGI